MADAKSTRLLPAVEVVDKVPLMVCRALNVTVFVRALNDVNGPVTVKLLNVLAPVTAAVPKVEFVKVRL